MAKRKKTPPRGKSGRFKKKKTSKRKKARAKRRKRRGPFFV